MVTDALVVYVRGELQTGKSRADIEKELFLKGGWSAVDVDEVFKTIDGPKPTPSIGKVKHHLQVRFGVVIVLMLVAGYAGWWLRDRQQFFHIPLPSFLST